MEVLRAAVADALSGRREEVSDASRIVNDEVERYRVASRARDAAPMVSALRSRVERARQAEFDRQRSKRSELSDDAVGTGRLGDSGHGGEAAPPTDGGTQGRGRNPEGRASGRSAPNAVRPVVGDRSVPAVARRSALRLATRGSPLALAQARRVAGLLEAIGVASSLVVVETEGDKRIDVPLDRLGGQGVFVKEVQAGGAPGERRCRGAFGQGPAGLLRPSGGRGWCWARSPNGPIHAMCWWVVRSAPSPPGRWWPPVRRGGGRSSANLRPDLVFTGLRGNLATRLRAVGTGGVAAVVVAKAALDRLAWAPKAGTPIEVLEPEVMIPQVGQGVLAVECRADDEVTHQALAAIDDLAVRALVTAERAFLSELGGGCTLPVGAHAVFAGAGTEPTPGQNVCGPIQLTGMLASGDGRVVLRHRLFGERPEDLGRAVARYLLEDGGGGQFVEWELPPLSREIVDMQVEG